jgi:peptidylprolyl isomerase
VRQKLSVLFVVAALLVTAACGSGSDDSSKAKSTAGTIKDVKITGDFGTAPAVKIDTPLKVRKASTEVLAKGSGDALASGQQALVHLSLKNGTTGKAIGSTYDQGTPTAITLNPQQMPASLATALEGTKKGSRVALAASAKDLYGAQGNASLKVKATDSLVIVVDIVAVQASDVLKGPKGAKQAAPADAPKIVEKSGKITALDFSTAPKKPSKKLQVITLVKGTGPKTTKSLATMNYLGQVYGTKKAFNNTFVSAPTSFPLGYGGVIPAWDKALVGIPVGSRVMLIAPPALAYGAQGQPDGGIPKNATLVFVVDILGASK